MNLDKESKSLKKNIFFVGGGGGGLVEEGVNSIGIPYI